jgi:hypothetical protein
MPAGKAKIPSIRDSVSVGNARSGGTGTISCRVRSEDGTVYSLSNNHVTARTNRATIGDRIAQPGRADGPFSPTNVIGHLSEFIEIRFVSNSNQIDAAITRVDRGTQGTATPSNGYGTPKSKTKRPRLGMRVQKHGRTTSLTFGRITAINAVVRVNYGANRVARFNRQIVVTGDRAGFIKGGDSGLLFATSRGGRTAIANRIDAVLDAFEVQIDDGSEQRKKPQPTPAPDKIPHERGKIVKFAN